jgi:prevent-host-death family protein
VEAAMKTVLTVTEVNQDFSKAQRAVANGPVIITHRGEPSLVLMSYKAFQAKSEKTRNLLERLHLPGVEDIEFDPPQLSGPSVKPADFE